jgi:hypothetical protein
MPVKSKRRMSIRIRTIDTMVKEHLLSSFVLHRRTMKSDLPLHPHFRYRLIHILFHVLVVKQIVSHEALALVFTGMLCYTASVLRFYPLLFDYQHNRDRRLRFI